MHTHPPVGIDAMAFALPRGYVDLQDLAQARGIPKEKYHVGLGVKHMAVAQPEEDPVSLAANAGRRLLRTAGIAAAEIGLCVVGTETAVDHAKPIAAFVHGLLGLPKQCRVFETKHACFGGTAGLLHAVDWMAAGASRGKSALVICTDIARYPLYSAGEPTQGAGAVAMLVRAQPRLLQLDVGVSGSYAHDVYDFWRPLSRQDACTEGQFSVQCYLEALSGSYAEWKKAFVQNMHLSKTCYHVPYGKMARKAHRHRRMLDGLSEQAADATFEHEVGSSLIFPMQTGNMYTGSLYGALISLLHHEAHALENQRIGLFSYGSGSTAEFFSGVVPPGAAAFVAQLQLAQPLQERQQLSVESYEAIRQQDAQQDQRRAPFGMKPWSSLLGDEVDLQKEVVFVGIDEAERRIYKNRTAQMTPANPMR